MPVAPLVPRALPFLFPEPAMNNNALSDSLEWLHPAVIAGTVLYAVIGVVVLWLAFVIIDKLTPYDLWKEIVEEKNLALGVMVGAMFIALGLIIAAAIHG